MSGSLDAQYREILTLSRQMLEAGKAQEWDSLLALEKKRQDLFSTLPAVSRTPHQMGLSNTLREILSCDGELMDKVEHWLQHARILLRMPSGHDDSQS